MKLHNSKDDFVAAVQAAGGHFGIPTYIIEKDYWVTCALRQLSLSKTYNEVVAFKGGTSLSKGFKLIRRFSEDIDLALYPSALGKGSVPKNQGQALHEVTKAICVDEFSQDDSKKSSDASIYKRVFNYPTSFAAPSGSIVQSGVVAEATLFGDPSPTEKVQIGSLVQEWLSKEDRKQDIADFGLQPFEVLVVAPEKTYCEKILAVLKRAEGDAEGLGRRARHLYDIHRLNESDRVIKFLKSSSVKEYFNGAFDGDKKSAALFKQNGYAKSKYKLFSSTEEVLKSIEPQYKQVGDLLFKDTLPDLNEIRSTIEAVGKIFDELSS